MIEPAVPASGPDPLDRHQLRRDQSIPTVTLLSGPVGLGIRRWRIWASNGRRAVAMPEEPNERAAVSAWIDVLAHGRDLIEDAVRSLTMITALPSNGLRSRLGTMTCHDFESFWASQPLDSRRDPSAGICRWLITSHLVGERIGPDLSEQLAAVVSSTAESPWLAVLTGLAGVVPATALPAILYALPAPCQDAAGWLAAAARVLASLSTATPAVPTALAAPAEIVRAFLHAVPDSRLTALLREGLVVVEAISEAALTTRLKAAGATVSSETLRCLASQGASEEVADALSEAARYTELPETIEQAQKARSAAERFLFTLLESLPQTAGLFVLNQALEFRHGNAPAEADLVAPACRLVIELDGGYYHLANRAAYRRDRHKDWEYQRHGYVVLRFLSEDVVARLEEVLDTILTAVAYRRKLQPDRGPVP